jgi:protein-disulfide isomerase
VSKKNRERKAGSDETRVRGKAAAGSELTRFYWIIGGVAVLGLAIVGWSVGSKALTPTVSEPITMEGLDDPTQLMQVARPVVKGDPNAPITIMEFADFQCPGCAGFFGEVEPQIQAEFLDTGKAKFAFYDFPLVSIHPHAFLASRAARCAEDQGKFWPYHDTLYRNQGRWAAQQNPSGLFEEYARQLGLVATDFSSCLRSDRHADVVTANMQLGFQMQIQGTPSVLVTAGKGVGRTVAATIEGIRAGVAAFQSGGG